MPGKTVTENERVYAEGVTKVRRAGRGKFELRWTEVSERRTEKTFTSYDKKEIDQKRKALLVLCRGTAVSLKKLPKFDGKSKFFRQAMGDVVKAAHEAANSADEQALSALHSYSKILTDVAKSYLPYGDHVDTEEELERLVKYHEETDKRSVTEDATEQNACASIADTLVGDT